MLIQQKLEYPLWKIPYFLIKSLLIFIKVIRTGILTPLIENKLFNKQTELILRILNFIFINNDQKEIGKISFLGKFYLKRNKIANKYGFIFSIAVNLAAILRSKIRGFYE